MAQEIRFHFSEEGVKQHVTLDTLIAFEDFGDGEGSYRSLRNIMAAFMVDANKKPLRQRQAHNALGNLQLPELKEVIVAFRDEMESWAVPKANGGGSSPPSVMEEEEQRGQES